MPTIAIFSYRHLTSLIHRLQYQPPKTVKIIVIDGILSDALEKARKMEETGTADVFLSAGGNAKLLSEHLKSTFVEIKVTGFDVLLALKEARKHSTKVGIVTYLNRISYLDQFDDVLAVPLKQVAYSQISDVDRILDNLQAEGVEAVIGGSLVLEVADQKGMYGISIYSTDGVTRALDTAVQLALSKKAEAKKAEELRTILDFAYGGIMATDQNGIVTVFNPSAEKITGIARTKILGHPVDKFLLNTRLRDVMFSCQPEFNQIQVVGDARILTNRIPIVVNGEVTGAVATFQDVDTVQQAEAKIRQNLYQKGFLAKTYLSDILGTSKEIIEAKRKVKLYAQNDSTVLIVGESGTGKELFAQGLHNASSRSRRPFVAVNCAALPENLLESELFGYQEGAFTGAKKGGKPGLFELAHTGTMFLDEIGEISKPLQSRLLRVLEEHEVLRIGGDRILPVNIRVIAATNKDLWDMVEKGLFREDLYYRLNVLELHLPPLRRRKQDIPLLVTRFLSELRPDIKKDDLEVISHNPLFRDHSWPGNVREVKNMVERFGVLYSVYNNCNELLVSILGKQAARGPADPEQAAIRKVLESFRGNKTLAAQKLGMSRTTLWRKLKNDCGE